MFERVYPVSEVVASKLLLTGYKHPSSFGKLDPVKVSVLNCLGFYFLLTEDFHLFYLIYFNSSATWPNGTSRRLRILSVTGSIRGWSRSHFTRISVGY